MASSQMGCSAEQNLIVGVYEHSQACATVYDLERLQYGTVENINGVYTPKNEKKKKSMNKKEEHPFTTDS
jgi:hypothetical protein